MNSRLTPLFEEHQRLNGKMVDYAGWSLPVQYSGISAEHLAVRHSAGLFDISHMGQVLVHGPSSLLFLDYLLPRSLRSVQTGRAYYSPMCQPDGGTVDDLLVYPLAEDMFLLVVNAANTDKDVQHIIAAADAWSRRGGVRPEVSDVSDRWAQIALQGPRSAAILQEILPWAAGLRPYHFRYVDAPDPLLVSRTGYTGEDGFEISLAPGRSASLWRRLLDLGAVPAGLGARDSLRLEAGMPLYGHELAPDITPLEAGLDRFVDLAKPSPGFIGQDALLRTSPRRSLVGLTSLGRAIPRPGYPVRQNGRPVGTITSGGFSPSLNIGIGLALVDIGGFSPDQPVGVWVREKEEPFAISPLPFVRRAAAI